MSAGVRGWNDDIGHGPACSAFLSIPPQPRGYVQEAATRLYKVASRASPAKGYRMAIASTVSTPQMDLRLLHDRHTSRLGLEPVGETPGRRAVSIS